MADLSCLLMMIDLLEDHLSLSLFSVGQLNHSLPKHLFSSE